MTDTSPIDAQTQQMIVGLRHLARDLFKAEKDHPIPPQANAMAFTIYVPLADVPFMHDTKKQIVYDPSNNTYDVWSNDGTRMLRGDLSRTEAVNLLKRKVA